MRTFTIINEVVTFKNPNTNKTAKIVKVLKEGTKRTFFAAQDEEGRFLSRVMFARQYEANKVAKNYCNA